MIDLNFKQGISRITVLIVVMVLLGLYVIGSFLFQKKAEPVDLSAPPVPVEVTQ